MSIDEIRELISIELNHSPLWNEELQDTTPGHYGVDNIECTVDPKNIWVDIPAGTFKFDNANLSFRATLGASRGDSSLEMNFDKSVIGNGTFKFKDAKSIEILEFKTEFDRSLF